MPHDNLAPRTPVVGGLLTSTVLTLVVIPSVYKWFAVERDEAESESGCYTGQEPVIAVRHEDLAQRA
jgi:hypothetical protein